MPDGSCPLGTAHPLYDSAPMSALAEQQDLAGYRLMLAFEGKTPPDRILQWIANRRVGGFSLFRPHNYDNPGQVRELTAALQRAARSSSQAPLLIATDQEGGQLTAMGEATTQFAGNMALGATGDAGLAYRVGRAIGLELAAMGVNINYAPVLDLNTNPANPSLGIRSFGDRPQPAGELGAATVSGLQSAGAGLARRGRSLRQAGRSASCVRSSGRLENVGIVSGRPAYLASRRRSASPARGAPPVSRRASALKCCDRPPEQCDAHHLDPYGPPTEGLTDIDNGLDLCRPHHNLVHKGWKPVQDANGDWYLQPP